MKLAAAAVGMDAARISREWEQQMTSRETPKGEGQSFGVRFSQALATTTESAVAARSLAGSIGAMTTTSVPADDGDRVLARLTEEILGKPVRLRESSLPLETGQPPLAWRGVSLSATTSYHVEESLFFAAQGSVSTVDGRDISFELNLSMTSRTTLISSTTIDAGLLLDPLVLQFDGASPLLGDSYFIFDLDGDGGMEQLSRPGWGCGFLAFDRNGDGVINDGLELFGPQSGSGFAELAQLDTDTNQWIDENDPIFSHLSIWRHNEDGTTELQTLAEAGVGAIAVTHAGTSFQLRADDGRMLGQVAATSIFLTEEGEVRALQELDLATGKPDEGRSTGGIGQAMLSPDVLKAVETLRHIVRMQRLRLRFLVLGQQARERQEVASRQDPLFAWLQHGKKSKENVSRPVPEATVAGGGIDERFYSQKT